MAQNPDAGRACGNREAAFYVATPREASELAAFFDRLIVQELLLLDIDSALQLIA